MANFHRDMTKGSVSRHLIRFSMPFLLSNLIQSLYSMADMVIVSHFQSLVSQEAATASVAGITNGGQITFLITNMVIGLSVGGTVLVGQYLGAGRKKDINETIGTLFSLLGICAAVLTVLSTLFSDAILTLLQTPAIAFSEAKSYFDICMYGLVFVFGYNAVSAVLRGMGDSKRPLIFVSIACATNVVLDLWFVGGLRMGTAGAALATIVSQALSLVLSVVYLYRSGFSFEFKWKSFRLHPAKVKLIFSLGLPTSVQNVVTSLSFTIMTAICNALGVNAVAAMGLVSRLNGFAIMPAVAMSSSVSAMVAQNVGAREYDRARHTMNIGIRIALGIGVALFAVVQLMPAALMKLVSNDPAVIDAGVAYLRVFSFDYLLVPFVFCMNGLITGSGHTLFSLLNSLVTSVALRVPIAWVLGIAMNWGLAGVGLAAPGASLGGLLLGGYYVLSGKWKADRTGIALRPGADGEPAVFPSEP